MTTMKVYELDAITETAVDYGMNEDAVRGDYSGRNMYGKTCVGVVGGLPDLLAFVLAAAAVRGDADEFSEPRQDSMGRDAIYYWPNVQIQDDAEDDDPPARYDVAGDSPGIPVDDVTAAKIAFKQGRTILSVTDHDAREGA